MTALLVLARRGGPSPESRARSVTVRFNPGRGPDLAVLKPRPDYYASGAPGASQILLLIEVMDTSVEYDRRRKTPLYARAGVAEVWLVDIPAGIIDVHREPTAAGYRDVRTLRRGETLAPLAFPDLTLGVGDVLGELRQERAALTRGATAPPGRWGAMSAPPC